jgi:hypothetical protein
MNITIVEVDGSLTNPLVLAAIGLWSAVLSFLAVLVARRTRGWLMRLSALIVLLALTVGRERQFVGRDAVSVYKCHHCNSTWHVPDDGRLPYVPPPKPRSF